jgi:hypothetical protein
MSASPPKEADVEQNAQSGEEQDHMDREQEGAQAGEFEVKEQDRWLPIANGWCSSLFIFCFSLCLHVHNASFTCVSPYHMFGSQSSVSDLLGPCVTGHASVRVSGSLLVLPVRIRVCDAAAVL